MTARLRAHRGASPLYCGVCGGRIAEMRPGSCVNETAHTPETEMENTPVARASVVLAVDPVSGTRTNSWSIPPASAPALTPPMTAAANPQEDETDAR